MIRLLALTALCCGLAILVAADAPLFQDANLEAVVRAHVPAKRDVKDALTVEDVKYLSEVASDGKPIKDLSGLDKCAALMQLNLVRGELTELGPLRSLTNLSSLTLSNNRIKDVSPLAGMTHVQYLDLSDNQISDLAPLARFESLNSLYLSNNRVTDLGPLKHASHLWSLLLAGNQIADLKPISGLKWLSSLDLKRNRIKDLSPLTGITSLTYLSLEENPVSDLTPLVNMTKKDAEGEKLFAPFLTIYLSPGQGSPGQLAELKKYVHEVNISGTRMERALSTKNRPGAFIARAPSEQRPPGHSH
jgi:internalin A